MRMVVCDATGGRMSEVFDGRLIIVCKLGGGGGDEGVDGLFGSGFWKIFTY